MMEIHEQLYLGDVVEMRKGHPCGGNTWEIVRVGADIGLCCQRCNRRVMLPRRKFARQARRFVQRGIDRAEENGQPTGATKTKAAESKEV